MHAKLDERDIDVQLPKVISPTFSVFDFGHIVLAANGQGLINCPICNTTYTMFVDGAKDTNKHLHKVLAIVHYSPILVWDTHGRQDAKEYDVAHYITQGHQISYYALKGHFSSGRYKDKNPTTTQANTMRAAVEKHAATNTEPMHLYAADCPCAQPNCPRLVLMDAAEKAKHEESNDGRKLFLLSPSQYKKMAVTTREVVAMLKKETLAGKAIYEALMAACYNI